MSVAPAFLNDDLTLNMDGLLEAHPTLKPQAAPSRAAASSSNPPADPREGGPLTLNDMQGKDVDWIRENWHRLDDGRGTKFNPGRLKK